MRKMPGDRRGLRTLTAALWAVVCLAPLAAYAQIPQVAGTWDSEQGTVTLTQTGTTVTGFWMRGDRVIGQITSGRVEQDRLTLRYQWGDNAGTAVFVMSARSRRWEGSFRHDSGAVGGWNLTPLSGAPAAATAPPTTPPPSSTPPASMPPPPGPPSTPPATSSGSTPAPSYGAGSTPDLSDLDAIKPPPQETEEALPPL